ncbi:metallophosphoesterase [Candidatus Woesearchaeota archaeon]|nr:metallophosphoesterase [Candidatus Woesearchaeota archaeon]
MQRSSWIPALLFALALGGCTPQQQVTPSLPTHGVINHRSYLFQGNTVTEETTDPDTYAVFGAISDCHGEAARARWFAEELKRQGAEYILNAGDNALNERLRYGRADVNDDRKEIKDCLAAMASTGLPVFVIPGNHETQTTYQGALQDLAAQGIKNIIDMTIYQRFDGDDLDIVALPGYHTKSIPGRKFIPDDGYWAQPENIKAAGALAQDLDDAVVLLSHGAPKTGSYGPGTISNGQDVGDEVTRKVMIQYNISFAVVGHIHEAGGLAANLRGEKVAPETWASSFVVNAGALENWELLNGKQSKGMALLVTISDKQARYKVITSE